MWNDRFRLYVFCGWWFLSFINVIVVVVVVVNGFVPSVGNVVLKQQQHEQQQQLVQQKKLHDSIGDCKDKNVVRLYVSTSTRQESDAVVLVDPMMSIGRGNRGDARGAAVVLEDVTVYRGPSKIVQNINWRVEPRTKWALVGSNGAGKSTLFKAIVGELSYDGTIIVGTKEKVGYLQQTAVSGSNKTIYEEACAGMTAINQARIAMEEAMNEGDLDGLERASQQFEALGGYQQDQKVSMVLRGLGFTNLDQKCTELSGGWQMRVAFARQLLSEPTLALLDEPGNHLDAAARKWLAQYLADYRGDGSMILVTHDIELLQSMDHIAEIIPNGGGIQLYKSCSYEQYLNLKQQRAAAAMAEFERNSEKAAKLQSFVNRFGASATKASAAQSRVKQLEKMKVAGLLDVPPDDVALQRFRPTMVLPSPPPAVGHVLLSLQNAGIGYDPAKPLVQNVTLEITKGMKLLIRGPNGSGKSTCLHSIRGALPLLSGTRQENMSLRLGMFTQDLAQELDTTARAVDLVVAYARHGGTSKDGSIRIDGGGSGSGGGDITISEQAARNALGRLGLTGEKSLRLLSELSGGEKARVALAMFSIHPSNVYFFDEPTNHLDQECVTALCEALQTWDTTTSTGTTTATTTTKATKANGAFVVVSHDRNFCQTIPFTHVATVQDGTFRIEERTTNDSDWQIDSLSSASATVVKSSSTNWNPPNNNKKNKKNDTTKQQSTSSTDDNDDKKIMDPKLRKLIYNAPKRITKLEQLISNAEQTIQSIDQEMIKNGQNVQLLTKLTRDKETIQIKIKQYEMEWEQLEQILLANV